MKSSRISGVNALSLLLVGCFFLISNRVALAASPASGVANASVAKNAALQMTSTLENSTTKMQYNYAENINDGRGITFGAIGFCTGTYDGNVLIKYYTQLNANNVLAKYIPALNAIDNGPHNSAGGDGNASVTGLGNFIQDVRGNTDPLFVTAQLYELDQLYWDPAIRMANAIGAKYNLTLAFIYDMSVRQGPDGAQDIIDSTTSQLGGSPATGINETTYLNKLMTVRDGVLKREGLGDVDRDDGFKAVLSSGNVNLKTPYTFTAYGDSFTIVDNANGITTTGSTVATRYALTVNGGTGDGSYATGTKVTIVAETPQAGIVFDRWTGSSALDSATSPTTVLTMPASAVTLTANYKTAPVVATRYALTVNGGTGDGSYAAGAKVTIVADAPATGKVFDRWTGSSALDSATSPTTVLTMPAATTAVTATYKTAPANTYPLTVNGGTGDGSYAAGTKVTIVADAPVSGKVFDKWTGSSALDSATAATTVLTMPAATTAVTAVYKSISTTSVSALTISAVPNAAATVLKGSTGVQLISINLVNTGTEDLVLSEIAFTGSYSTRRVSNLALYREEVQVGTPIASRNSSVAFSGMVVNIAKGESVVLTLKGDISNTNRNASVMYTLVPSKVAAKNASGAKAKVSATGVKSKLKIRKIVASLSAEIASGATSSVAQGAQGAQLIAIKFTNTGDEASVLNTLEISKSYSSVKVANFKLYAGDVEIGTPDRVSSSKVVFKDLQLSIAKGESMVLVLKGDVPEAGSRSSLSYQIRSGLAKARGASGDSAQVSVTRGKTVLTIESAA